MAKVLQSSGPIKISQIADEYREGTGNNSPIEYGQDGTGVEENVQAPRKFSDFYNREYIIKKYANTAAELNTDDLADLFTASEASSPYRKRIYLGAFTDPYGKDYRENQEITSALKFDATGFSETGSIEIRNSAKIWGSGGKVGGEIDGGHALGIFNIPVNNNFDFIVRNIGGELRGGGGAGAAGGRGGEGQYVNLDASISVTPRRAGGEAGDGRGYVSGAVDFKTPDAELLGEPGLPSFKAAGTSGGGGDGGDWGENGNLGDDGGYGSIQGINYFHESTVTINIGRGGIGGGSGEDGEDGHATTVFVDLPDYPTPDGTIEYSRLTLIAPGGKGGSLGPNPPLGEGEYAVAAGPAGQMRNGWGENLDWNERTRLGYFDGLDYSSSTYWPPGKGQNPVSQGLSGFAGGGGGALNTDNNLTSNYGEKPSYIFVNSDEVIQDPRAITNPPDTEPYFSGLSYLRYHLEHTNPGWGSGLSEEYQIELLFGSSFANMYSNYALLPRTPGAIGGTLGLNNAGQSALYAGGGGGGGSQLGGNGGDGYLGGGGGGAGAEDRTQAKGVFFNNTPRGTKREIYQVVNVDTQLVDQVTFDVLASDGSWGEPPDNGEDVQLQYSTDGGSTWTLLKQVGYPGNGIPERGVWYTFQVELPVAAKTSTTRFKINQLKWTAGDQWAVSGLIGIKSTGAPIALINLENASTYATDGATVSVIATYSQGGYSGTPQPAPAFKGGNGGGGFVIVQYGSVLQRFYADRSGSFILGGVSSRELQIWAVGGGGGGGGSSGVDTSGSGGASGGIVFWQGYISANTSRANTIPEGSLIENVGYKGRALVFDNPPQGIRLFGYVNTVELGSVGSITNQQVGTLRASASNYDFTTNQAYTYIEVNGTNLNRIYGRGHTLAIFDPDTLDLVSITTYDTYASVENGQAFYTALQNVADGQIIVVVTFDASRLVQNARNYLNANFGTTATTVWDGTRVSHTIIARKNTPATDTFDTFEGIGPGQVVSDLITVTTGANSDTYDDKYTKSGAPFTEVPDAPTNVVASTPEPADDGRVANISWTAPTYDGFSAITSYRITALLPGQLTGTSITVTAPQTTATFINLDRDKQYRFIVEARNAVGYSERSQASNVVFPAGEVAAPVNLITIPGNSKIMLEWTSADQSGGANVQNYYVDVTPDGEDTYRYAATRNKYILVQGLTNGKEYAFTVTADNYANIATSQPKTDIPYTKPGTPTITSVNPSRSSCEVIFIEPENNGNAITEYQVQVRDVLNRIFTATGSSSPITVTGLPNDVELRVRVRAKNAAGYGQLSVIERTACTGVPFAPTITSVVRGDEQAFIYYTPPSDDGGSDITDYLVYNETDEDTIELTKSNPLIVPNLINGTSYTFRLAAINEFGAGDISSISNAVVPAGRPDAPVPTATDLQLGRRVRVDWPIPNDRGEAITEYRVYNNVTGSVYLVPSNTNTLVVSSLTNGREYTFNVIAFNDVGASDPGTSNSVVPTGIPDSPVITNLIGQNKAINIFFQSPNDNGSPITHYYAEVDGTAVTSNANVSPLTITGLSNDVAYTGNLYAVNAVGNSTPRAFGPVTPILYQPSLGEFFEGGYYAGDISIYANGFPTHRLIVAPVDTEITGFVKSVSDNGANSTYDGANNTAILAASGNSTISENIPVINSYNDWYIPSLYELEIAYYNLKPSTSSSTTTYGFNVYAVPRRTTLYSSGNPGLTSAENFRFDQRTQGTVGRNEAFTPATYWTSTEGLVPEQLDMTRFSMVNGAWFRYNSTSGYKIRFFRKVLIDY